MNTKLICLIFVFIGYSITIQAQSIKLNALNSLPENLEIDKSTPQTYRMTTDYFDFDLTGNFIRKAQVAGDFTCFLDNDSVRWNNVSISESSFFDKAFPEGQKQANLEDLKYIPSPDCLKEQFFSSIPNIDFRLKNLIWDMIGFEIFAYLYWDSLKLNTVFSANAINGEIKMANDGVFENKEIKLIWIGITKFNNELCAIIKYSQMNGKLKLKTENISMKGRSHYWGEVYVSLEDKQIEYATLTEDVVTDVLVKGQENNFLGYTVRNIKLEKKVSHEKK